MPTHETTIYLASAAIDAAGTFCAPAAVVASGHVIAVSSPHDPTLQKSHGQARTVDLGTGLILPAMVNAHAHLDLTRIGPMPYTGNFPLWLRQVVQRRPTSPQAIADAVHHGLLLSRQAGVLAIGDIAGSAQALLARLQATHPPAPAGVSFLECFGLGPRQPEGWAYLQKTLAELPTSVTWTDRWNQPRVGIQPHAPYSVGPEFYRRIARLAAEKRYRLSTHLAESPAELQFVRQADGPFRQILEQLGKWDDSIRPEQQHPADALAEIWPQAPWLLAHGNYLTPDHAKPLADAGVSIAYCPIASDYFGYPHDRPHPYRMLLDHGVNVALGTDSILCQPPEETQPLGILPAMRFLYRRDRTDPMRLLKMATIHGAIALGLPPETATLKPNPHGSLGIIHVPVDPPTTPTGHRADSTADAWLKQMLLGDAPVTLLEATACPCPDVSGSSASAPSDQSA